jgi:NADH-quinone oxidoreductase subunit L
MADTTLKTILSLAILFLPLLASAAIMLLTRRHPRLSAGLSVGAVAAGFICSVVLFVNFHGKPMSIVPAASLPGNLQWLSMPGFAIDLGLLIDPLSLLTLLIVTGVGLLVHVFSLAYMRDDEGVSRYFAGLSLFMFSMLGIVLAANFVLMFIFWELVGVSSYLLISHWFQKPAAADAGKKAFIVNRIGDVGFLLGILLVWQQLGSFSFNSLAQVSTVAGLLIFCGAVGKSAQFPLHVWLPDAMEGPTPVSALIHAATMVAAGVYMLCRVFAIFTYDALLIIGWIGGLTALIAALMAVQQNDLKRILAYSTVSQLGYMVMAVGCAAPAAGMFHLTTHAAFKALLFLGAGAVLYACHHEQDIWKLGGLRKKMPLTYRAFVTGALALAGFPLLSGFFSKDAILAQAFDNQMGLFVIGVAVVVLTAFYMMRCVLVVFHGESRADESDGHGHPQDPPGEMIVPLLILAALSIGLGWKFFGLSEFLNANWRTLKGFTEAAHHAAMIWGTLAAFIGLGLGWFVYRNASEEPLNARVLRNKFYFDEFYAWLNRWTQEKLSHFADWFDRWIIAGAGVKGLSGAADITGYLLRLFQSGNLQSYALLLALGLLLMLGLFLF